MNKFLAIALLFASCGSPEDDIKHPTPIDPVTPPLSTTDLVPKRWIAQDGQDLVMVDLEPKFGTTDTMFHFRLCSDTDCFDPKFLAVGTFKLVNTNDMCFSDIAYWKEPPAGFIIQSTDNFCGYGVLDADVLKFRVQTQNGIKNLNFKATKLPFYE